MKTPLSLDVAARLNNARKSRDITQESIAKSLGVAQSAVSKWLTGRGLDLDSAQMLCEAIQEPLSGLIAEILDEKRPSLSPTKRAIVELLALPALDEKKARVLLQSARIMAGLPPDTGVLEEPGEKKHPAR